MGGEMGSLYAYMDRHSCEAITIQQKDMQLVKQVLDLCETLPPEL